MLPVGEIKLSIWRVVVTRQERQRATAATPEDCAKHKVNLGPETRRRRTANNLKSKKLDSKPLVTFIFKYQPRYEDTTRSKHSASPPPNGSGGRDRDGRKDNPGGEEKGGDEVEGGEEEADEEDAADGDEDEEPDEEEDLGAKNAPEDSGMSLARLASHARERAPWSHASGSWRETKDNSATAPSESNVGPFWKMPPPPTLPVSDARAVPLRPWSYASSTGSSVDTKVEAAFANLDVGSEPRTPIRAHTPAPSSVWAESEETTGELDSSGLKKLLLPSKLAAHDAVSPLNSPVPGDWLEKDETAGELDSSGLKTLILPGRLSPLPSRSWMQEAEEVVGEIVDELSAGLQNLSLPKILPVSPVASWLEKAEAAKEEVSSALDAPSLPTPSNLTGARSTLSARSPASSGWAKNADAVREGVSSGLRRPSPPVTRPSRLGSPSISWRARNSSTLAEQAGAVAKGLQRLSLPATLTGGLGASPASSPRRAEKGKPADGPALRKLSLPATPTARGGSRPLVRSPRPSTSADKQAEEKGLRRLSLPATLAARGGLPPVRSPGSVGSTSSVGKQAEGRGLRKPSPPANVAARGLRGSHVRERAMGKWAESSP
ncbi:hypothetical protein HWV62_33107 [Athelia sp. TMB]|nr:hypothetical protein HWV62_33107 [Athelia sp. TMB]